MVTRTHLTPISYHLRNFNKYVSLDLAAAGLGNLTLVGENAAGKTTLANCFFPMLIDGSIATPSFNAARGTERVAKANTARNSRQDTRTFESMLLGWGPGAMKVRTGYSYLCLASEQRQVILGIGAQRITGASGSTWWFVAQTDGEAELPLVTTDAQGASLSEADFVKTNAALGKQLHVFKQADAYREFVAHDIYGFSNAAILSQLANVYRLLASPILTAGGAKFSPIRAALRDAQASIDRDVIYAAAATQREVNQKNGLLQRIKRGQQRLEKLQRDIFWGDLNHLNETKLGHYAEIHAEYEQEKAITQRAEEMIAKYTQQLHFLQLQLTEKQELVQQLNEAKAKQKVIEEQRASLQRQVASEQQRLQKFLAQEKKVAEFEQQLAILAQQTTELQTQTEHLKKSELAPLQVQLNANSANLHELAQVLAQTDIAAMNHQFVNYIQQIKRQMTAYQNLAQQATNLSQDVAIVGQMQDQMAESIDRRAQGPLVSRFRAGLRQDNQTIHEAGAAKMNAQFQQIKQQQADLLAKHPDVKLILAQPTLLATLSQQQKTLATLVARLADLVQQQDKLQLQQAGVTSQLVLLRDNMESDLIPAEMKQQITVQQQQLAQLVVDEQLAAKLADAKQAVEDFSIEKQDLESKKNVEQGQQNAADNAIKAKTTQLDILATQVTTMLQVLQPYLPPETPLTEVAEVIQFVRAHGSEVRNNRYSEIADRIRRAIHRNNQDGIDRNALDTLFTERGYGQIASAMYQGGVVENDMTTLAFDIREAQQILNDEFSGFQRAVAELETGNELAKQTYLSAAVERIADQYQVISKYNQILAAGLANGQGIKLKVDLRPADVTADVITEACDLFAEKRPALTKEVQRRLDLLANDAEVADDDAQFMQRATDLLDTRQWSAFHVLIKRRQSGDDDFEEVDDKFVRSGGSGAEKAQAMVLPLLLVPKMLLQQSSVSDVPYLVMFDEFADKLDPETAKAFARTIANFGFDFIATMPSGAQNKILADGVANIAYEVIAAAQQNDGKFHTNRVVPVLRWQEATPDD